MIRFRASAWRTKARKKEASRLTVLEWCVAEGWSSRVDGAPGGKEKQSQRPNKESARGCLFSLQLRLAFGSVLWGLPARLSALAEPVRRTTLESHRSFPAPCLLGFFPNHHPSQFGIHLALSSARSKSSERVLYGPQNIMLLVRTLNYIYI